MRGESVVIAPLHNRVGGIRADNCYAFSFVERKNPVFVIEECHALSGHFESFGFMGFAIDHRIGNLRPGHDTVGIEKPQFKTGFQQPADRCVDLCFGNQAVSHGLYQR